MKKALIAVLVFSISLNLLLIAAIANQNFGIPVAEAIKNISEPGTYGPPAMEIIDGDATINTIDVTLQNLLITGNLLLTDQVNEGTINLSAVQVQGEIIIAGSGFTLRLHDCPINKITVQEKSPAVKLIASGTTKVDHVSVAAETSLQEDGLAEGALGFCNIQVLTGEKVILVGDFDTVEIATPKANVKVPKGSIVTLLVKDAGAVLDLAKDTIVNTIVMDGTFQLKGDGNVQVIDLNVPGRILLQGQLGQVTCNTDGIFLEFHAGSMEKLLVPPMETAVSVMLAEDTHVEYVELNARAGFTGQGQIEKAVINHDGVTMDRPPAIIDIQEGIMAMIAGEEYIRESEPEPEPGPEPLPLVGLNSPSTMTLMVNNSGTKSLTPNPTDAVLKVSSSNTSVATVSLSGKTLKVTGKKSGTATITVKASKNGYRTRTRTFKVTVNALSDVKDFVVDESSDSPAPPGSKLVFVYLYDPDPSQYTVRIGDVEFRYRPEHKMFQGIVLDSQAEKSNVRVSK